MNLSSHLVQRVLKLDPPPTRKLTVQRDLRVPMPDGVELLADRWVPSGSLNGTDLPVALIRSPYGRRGPLATGVARPLAERGFQVLLQSTRGTFGSGGEFDPMRRERDDGLATLDWLIKQPWFGGSIVLTGPSYLGFVQWAVADSLPPEVKAIIPQVTESALTLEFLRKDGLSLETPFSWGVLVAQQERPMATLRSVLQAARTEKALATIPLSLAGNAALGHRSDYIQDILACDADDPRWAGLDHRDRVAHVTAPVSSIAGWYDIFLPGQLRDFGVLQAAGLPARLTVGPWTHLSVHPTPVHEAISFALPLARGGQPAERAPVRLFVMGQEEWRDFDAWPPGGYEPRSFYLRADGGLSAEGPDAADAAGAVAAGAVAAGAVAAGAVGAGPDTYRYDPADPTPAAGGVRMVRESGRVDNTALEARSDVLCYTTPPLDADVEVIGEVSAQIWFRSSLPFADVFVRLCDVHPDGRSYNVCDGLTSLAGADQLAAAQVRLWPTAHRFGRGHRIRVQVSSGAFPRFARNPGTGEPHASAVQLLAAEQAVYHDAGHPSAIILPVRSPGR